MKFRSLFYKALTTQYEQCNFSTLIIPVICIANKLFFFSNDYVAILTECIFVTYTLDTYIFSSRNLRKLISHTSERKAIVNYVLRRHYATLLKSFPKLN